MSPTIKINQLARQLALGLTDLAVLSLMPDPSTPILEHFYGRQSLSVQTASTLTINVDEETAEIMKNLARSMRREIFRLAVAAVVAAVAAAVEFSIRQRYIDTPLWETVVTDMQMEMQRVKVTLPDNTDAVAAGRTRREPTHGRTLDDTGRARNR